MDADDPDPPPLPVLDYGRAGPTPPAGAAPGVGCWTLLVGHAVLLLIGCAFALAALVGVTAVPVGWSSGLFCGGVPGLIGVACLGIGVRGLCRLGRDDDPTWGGRR